MQSGSAGLETREGILDVVVSVGCVIIEVGRYRDGQGLLPLSNKLDYNFRIERYCAFHNR